MKEPSTATIGIVANPASGHDIRRLVARASVFHTTEKCNMVQRVLSAVGPLGVARALVMPDRGGITAGLQRALDRGHHDAASTHWPEVEVLDLEVEGRAADTVRAVQAMVERGVRVIVVLGGDGTNRLVAAHAGDLPLVTLSTGTNNTFPDLREATVAGMAAGLVATGGVPVGESTRRNKVLEVTAGGRTELALVDVCVTTHLSVGARAVWDPSAMTDVLVTFAEPDAIGLSSIAGLTHPVGRDEPHGLHVRLGEGGQRLLAPIAPGMLAVVPVAEVRVLAPDEVVPVGSGHGVIAVDGEREVELAGEGSATVRLRLDGPRTVDVARTLRLAAERGLLTV